MAKPKKVTGSLEFDQEAEIALRQVAKGLLNTVSELTINKIVDSSFKQKLEEVERNANDLLKKLNQGAAIMPKDLENFTTSILKANDLLDKAKTRDVFQNKEVQQFQQVTKGGVSVFPTPNPKALEMKEKAQKMENVGVKMQDNLNRIADNAIKIMEHTKPTQEKQSLFKKFADACKSFVKTCKTLLFGKKEVQIVRKDTPAQTRKAMLSDTSREKQQGVAGMGKEAVQKAKERDARNEPPRLPPKQKGRSR